MKRGILVLSLFLISILFISGCDPQLSKHQQQSSSSVSLTCPYRDLNVLQDIIDSNPRSDIGDMMVDELASSNNYTRWDDNDCLSWLYLHNVNLYVLPESIGNLRDVEKIRIHDNQLTSLPDSIGNLKNLKNFFFDNNEIKSLPISIGNLGNLERLTFGWNKLTSLPQSLSNLENLVWIAVWGNHLYCESGIPTWWVEFCDNEVDCDYEPQDCNL